MYNFGQKLAQKLQQKPVSAKVAETLVETCFYQHLGLNRCWQKLANTDTHSPSAAHWKTCGQSINWFICMAAKSWIARLTIRHNRTFFTNSYGWDVISGNLSKLAFFEGLGHFEHKFQTEDGNGWCQKTKSDYPFVWYQNICSALFAFVIKHTCERQTDRKNYHSKGHASIATSHSNKLTILINWIIQFILHIRCVPKKFPPLESLYLCQILTDFQNFRTTGKHMKFATKPIWRYPSYLRYVGTLAWEIKN